ncbi:hypothetical protein EGJ86_23505 [Pseudomonas sp. o96-267]|nr:hypothetical protein EGJ86_23505 [Pseudomonas sp. o96-267]
MADHHGVRAMESADAVAVAAEPWLFAYRVVHAMGTAYALIGMHIFDGRALGHYCQQGRN